MSSEDKETADWLDMKQAMYLMLGNLFYKEADRATLDLIRQANLSEIGQKTYDRGLKLFLGALETLTTEEALDDLAAQYARIFLGAGVADEVCAFPFESVYTSPERLVAQDAYEEVYKIFKASNFKKIDSNLFDDHLGLELFAVAEFYGDARAYLENGDREKFENTQLYIANFLRAHLLNWVPAFCEDIRRCPGGDFYRGLSYMLEGFLETEKAAYTDIPAAG